MARWSGGQGHQTSLVFHVGRRKDERFRWAVDRRKGDVEGDVEGDGMVMVMVVRAYGLEDGGVRRLDG